jgi:hypothetical protein
MKNASASRMTGTQLRSIHLTEDGPIFGAVHNNADGKWEARNWGKELNGSRVCDSIDDANAYLIESFQQMFPDHVCTAPCRQELV